LKIQAATITTNNPQRQTPSDSKSNKGVVPYALHVS